MFIYNRLKQDISGIFTKLFKLPPPVFNIEKPKVDLYGDFSTNISMVSSKLLARKPLDIAGILLTEMVNLPYIKKAEIAGSGFINIFVDVSFLTSFLPYVFEVADYGLQDIGKGEKINVEFVSANPTGPLHIGHTRGAVYGDVLAELLSKMGYNVTREYYINDAGNQVKILVKSVFIRYKQLLGENIEIPEGCYPGEYLIDLARGLLDKFGADLQEDNPKIEEYTLKVILDWIKLDLAKINIKHDVFTSEKSIRSSGGIEKALEILDKKGLLYYGVLPEPKGKKIENWEEKELYLFKSKQFGDTEDRAVKKPDGSYTYFVPDIAYSHDKIKRGFKKMILVLGADHLGVLTRIKAATLAVAENPEEIEWKPLLCQIVRFLENGEPIKMSKRKGTFTTLAEVLEEVPVEIIRFIMLTKKNDIGLDFDLVKVKEETKDNPVFYIQYASARIHSVLNKLPAEFDCKNANLNLLTLPKEIELIKKILDYPQVIYVSTVNYEPHHIAFYLYELVTIFHSLWNIGNEDPEARFITDDLDLTKARIYLISCVLRVIKSAFLIFKIKPLEKL